MSSATAAIVGQAVVGQAVVGGTGSTGVYLYSPPQWQQHQVIAGALRYRVTASTTVYRISGVWYNVLSPGVSNPDPASCDVLNGQLLYFNTPTPVPASLHDELAALGPADPSWSPGSLTSL